MPQQKVASSPQKSQSMRFNYLRLKPPYSLEELFCLRKEILKDILKEDLEIIFVDSAASDKSASMGHYYAILETVFGGCFTKRV